MSKIHDFQPFVGAHCETTATGNLLAAAGLDLSEPMLFGLGEALAFGVFTFTGAPAPFLAGRTKPDALSTTLAANLGLDFQQRTTRSSVRAWRNVSEFIDAGKPVAVKLNFRFLDYVDADVDFAGHYVAVYGYDEEKVFVVDTAGQGGPNVTSRTSFEAGRLWKGPMASNALTWTLDTVPDEIDWTAVIFAAIARTADSYLNPAIRNFGASGIRKTATLIPGWLDRYRAEDLAQLGAVMERGGTGGGLFRPMYAAFLRKVVTITGDDALFPVAEQFDSAGELWSEVAGLLEDCEQGGRAALDEASSALSRIADLEEDATRQLLQRYHRQHG